MLCHLSAPCQDGGAPSLSQQIEECLPDTGAIDQQHGDTLSRAVPFMDFSKGVRGIFCNLTAVLSCLDKHSQPSSICRLDTMCHSLTARSKIPMIVLLGSAMAASTPVTVTGSQFIRTRDTYKAAVKHRSNRNFQCKKENLTSVEEGCKPPAHSSCTSLFNHLWFHCPV
jgi:hypothetical protein